MSEWLFLSPWPVIVLVTMCLIMIGAAILRAFFERRRSFVRRWPLLLTFRIAAIALLLWVAMNPTAIRPKAFEGRPALVVLLDKSGSMATSDVDGDTRWDAAVNTLQDSKVLAELNEHFALELKIFDGDTAPVDATELDSSSPDGRASDMGAALTQAVIDQADKTSQAGVLLISDGRVTSPGAVDAARLGLARAVPLWTWRLGGEVPRRDLWVQTTSSETLAFAGSEVQIGASLHQVGLEHQTFSAELLSDDEVIQRFEVNPQQDGGSISATITAPGSGEQRFTFRAVPVPGEADTQNNHRSIYVRSVGDKVRVFLAEGQPHWDTKFLVQSLKRNDRVELTAVYRMGPDRQFAVFSVGEDQRREQGDHFPRTIEDWSKYDVVIMGRGCEAFFDDDTDRLLTEFVSRRGGGLIFNRGKSYGGRFRSLAKFEPVVWGNRSTQTVTLASDTIGESGPLNELAPDGNLDALLDRLPRFDQTRQTVGIKPLAVVMAGGQPMHGYDGTQAGGEDDLVLMAYQLFGQGRVLTVNTSGLWRWAFRERGEPVDEFIYDRLWGGLLRWIISGSDFLAGHQTALRSSRRTYTDQQPVRFLIRTRQVDPATYQPRLTIEGGGQTVEIQPRSDTTGGDQNTWLAESAPLTPGSYQVTLTNNVGTPATLTTKVEVVSGSIEDRQLSADPELMQRLADLSEGKTLEGRDLARFSSIFSQWRADRRLSDEKHPLWDRWWIFLAMIGLLAVEWFLRRQENLL